MYRVHGSKGVLQLMPAFPYQGLHLTAQLDGGHMIDEPSPERDPAHFVREADYFADCIWQNKEPKSDGEEGLRDMELMSEIYKSAGLPGL